jgi:glycosyltransferase involved in cell wall biosynthesis
MNPNKPKIVVDIDRMKYPNTGMFEFCSHLYDSFKDNTSFDFIFYKHKQTILDNHSKVLPIGIFDRLFLRVSSKVQIWHTTNQLATRIPSNPKKLVYTIHDLNFLYASKSEKKKEKLLKQIQKAIYQADYLTFISNFSYLEVKKHLDIEEKKYKIIHNGVSVKTPEQLPNYLPKRPFLFSLGVIDPKKNIHTILPLLAVSDFDLIISGKITNEKYYQTILLEIKRLELQDRVVFTNVISENDKYWYLKNCEAFVFPSISEGFGIPPIEAMRFGKPVFLSNLTSLPEIGGSAAFYFNDFEPQHMQQVFLNGMKLYQDHPNKKQEIVNWSLQFTWEKASQAYLEVYKELL